ncbi:MAG: IPTL-CTERM sorting domain-containing protein [Thermoanaerobaculia bacterium]
MLRDRSSRFLASVGVAALLCGGLPLAAQTAPPLGTTTTFAVLGGSTVTNTGTSVLTGDLGVWPGLAITGFPPGNVTGTTHAGDAVAQQAQTDLTAAYNNLAGQACGTVLTGQDLGGMTLAPGVYCFSTAAQLTGTLTLDAQGDPGAIFIFQIGSTLTTASSSSVELINGGSSCNVFWQVGSSATLGTSTTLAGSILALQSITLTTTASVSGQLLARNGAVTLDTGTVGICIPACPLITVSPATLPTGGQPAVPYSVQLSATGGTAPYTFAVTSGALPAGLTLSTAGLLSGTPTAPGTFTFTVTATDDAGCTGFRVYTITINPATCPTMTILPDVLPNTILGAPYSQPITASGSTPDTYVYTVTAGALPPGLALSPLTATKTVTLAGIPTTIGNYSFTITATDENNCQVSHAYTILVNPAACPTVTVLPATLPYPELGLPYAETISATGGAAPYTFSVTAGALPPGLSLGPLGPDTASLSGTPTATGLYHFTITALDANGCPGTRAYTMTVGGASGIPTLSTWGLLLLMTLTGLVAIRYLGRAA